VIAHLRGAIVEKGEDSVVLEAAGVGYEVVINPSTARRLPSVSNEAALYICEAVAMYGGGTTLYGFLSREEKQMFLTFKSLSATGAKKALDHLERASHSLEDFCRAVLNEDARVLTGIFGFTKKTADKLIRGLKEKIGALPVSGAEHMRRHGGSRLVSTPMSKALEALSSLGYKPMECRSALEAIQQELAGGEVQVEEIIRLALRRL